MAFFNYKCDIWKKDQRERERKNWWNDMFQFMFNEEETKLNNQQQQWVQQDQQQLK